MNMRSGKVWTRAVVLAIAIAGSAFAIRQFRHSRSTLDLPTAQARRGDFPVLVHCRGQLVAARSVQLTAPIDVEDLQIVWLAPAGGPVKEGMDVIHFDPSKLQQDLKEKQSALRQAQASLDQALAQAKITADQDTLDLEKARYDMERARLEASKQAIISAIDGEKSTIDLGLAREKVKVQDATDELHKKSDEAKIASQRRLRDEAKAEVDRTERRLAAMVLKSPLNGVINYMQNRSQGWFNAQPFKVGDHASPGMVIAEIPDLSTLEMESKVEEVDRGRMSVGDAVQVHVDAFPEKTMQAKLVSISPLTEQAFEEWPPTRTFRAFAEITNADVRMRPGMNASADVIQERIPDAISVPAKALFTRNGQPVVYARLDSKYIAKQVRIRGRNTDDVAVEGIAQGTYVALTDPQQVRP